MMLHKITDATVKNQAWEKFRPHHYSPDDWAPSADVFLATEIFNGKEVIVGMSAALPAPSGTTYNAYRSHKVAVLPPCSVTGVWGSPEKFTLPDYDAIQMWRAVADAQAVRYTEEGHPYLCNAGNCPKKWIAYRDDSTSGWVPTSKHAEPPKDKGHSSKKFGTKPRAMNAEGLVVSHWWLGKINPEAIGKIVKVPNELYNSHPLPKMHVRGSEFGGTRRECWAYKKDEVVLGFAVMAVPSHTLKRVIVVPLQKKECIAIGQALIREMCKQYPSWTSLTDVKHEAAGYHEYYKVEGVEKGKPKPKPAPKELDGIPLSVKDWRHMGKCRRFLAANPKWHRKISEMPRSYFYELAPGGKTLSDSELREKIQDTNHAGRMLARWCPTTQITYRFSRAS